MTLADFRSFVKSRLNNPTTPIDAIPDELDAWRRYELSRLGKSASRVFEADATRGDIADVIYAALYNDHLPAAIKAIKACDCSEGACTCASEPFTRYTRKAITSADTIHQAFDKARTIYDERLKAIQATRLDFEMGVADIIAEAREGNISKDRFRRLMRAQIRRFGLRAFDDGLQRHGVDPAEKTDDDMMDINNLIKEQTPYVYELAETIYGTGISNAEAANKPAMWFNRSVKPFYQRGELSAAKNGMFEWVMGPTIEHCRTCLAASGQRHRLKSWHKAGILPQSNGHKELECHGFNCKCNLVPTSGRARGRLDRIPTV